MPPKDSLTMLVSPIFMNGDRLSPANCRAIAALNLREVGSQGVLFWRRENVAVNEPASHF